VAGELLTSALTSSADTSSWLTIESFTCKAKAKASAVGVGVEQPLRCTGETLRDVSSPPVL
jgi:hypothetical protein